MKRLSDIAGQMAETTPEANTPISSNPDYEAMRPLTITCTDPEHPDEPCPICQGMGVIKYAVEPEDPRFGKLFRCPNNPVEVDVERQMRLRRMSNLAAFDRKTFETFDIQPPGDYSLGDYETLRKALHLTQAFADRPRGWLLLEGKYGTGKTHLAAAVGHERLKRGDVVLFITTPDLLDYLRSTFGPSAETAYDDLFDRVRNAQMLILDDLGVENPSDWAREKLFQLLNHRYSHELPTVITTNVELEHLDARIGSRLTDRNLITKVALAVPDYRGNMTNRFNHLLTLIDNYRDMTFDTFDISTNTTRDERNNLEKAAQIAAHYALDSEENRHAWLLLMGNFGCGKTHLAAAIANERRKHENVMFLTTPDLLDYLRTTFAPDSPVTFDKLFEQVRNVPLLVLDDLGAESTKPWAQEKLFQILDYRYVTKKSTVFTTAKNLNELNERLRSRLLDQRLCLNFAITARSYAERTKRS